MSWLFALIGAFLGAGLADASDDLMGLAVGAFVGWLFGSLSRLKSRIAELEKASSPAHPAPSPERVRSAPPTSDLPLPLSSAPVVPAVSPASQPVPAPGWSTPPVPADPRKAEPPEMERDAADARRAAGMHDEESQADWRAASVFERATRTIRFWFTDGNVPVKIGMLVLFFGVAALLKYAVDQGMLRLPVDAWFALVAAVAVAGLILGWRQRETRRAFGLALQGGALGVLLLTVFAAFRIHHLLLPGVALGLVVFLVAASAVLAVLQHALALAVLGFTGGFLAPVLISSGSGDHVALFSWYAVLNAAVFAVAWLRPWRVLNLVGFGFTFVVGSLWGYQYYTPAHFSTVEPFLMLFFLFYVGIGVLYILRQPEVRRPYVDGTLTFGTPLLAFPLQAALLEGNDFAMAFSALAVALLYLVLFAWLRRREGFRVQGEAFAGLAIAFATLAVPLALSAQWTASTWALEGAALVWLGLREDRRLPRLSGLALQLLAGAAFSWGLLEHGYALAPGELPVLNGRCLGALMIAFAGFFISWRYERMRPHRGMVWAFFLWAFAWWALAGLREVDLHVASHQTGSGIVGFTAFTILFATLLRNAMPWARLGWIVAVGIVLGVPLASITGMAADGPFDGGGWIAWLGFGLVAGFALHRLRDPLQRALSIAHVALLFTLPLLVGLELSQLSREPFQLADGWTHVLTILPLFFVLVASWRAPRVVAWPLADLFPVYRMRWFVPAAGVLLLWWLAGLGQPGNTAPLPFVPLANPLELMQFAILLVLWFAVRDGTFAWPHGNERILRNALLLATFVTLTFATLRAVHHATGLAWDYALLDSMVAQTSLTVVWSVVGMAAWIAGSKRVSRPLWLAGALLMGIVLAKLALVDRAHMGNIAGIVSFIAVGLLLTVVGYFAPSPPRRALEDPGP